jgi:RND superfamily putative drug exporter
MIAAGRLDPGPVENVLVTAPGGGPLDRSQARGVAREIAHDAADAEGVTGVDPPVFNRTGTAMLVNVRLAPKTDDAAPVQRVTDRIAVAHPELTIREAGEDSINTAINDRVGEDLHSAEGISLPVTLLLMLLAFGALIAAGVPVLLALTSVAATMGIAAPLSHLIHAEPTTTSMIVLIGMAVGVDYSLFYLKREREERAAGRSTLDAVDIAAATSGHSILVSGAAVILSLASLFLVQMATFASLAAGAIVVVAVAVIGSVTVLPALLAKLGRWTDRPRVPLLWRLNRRLRHRLGPGGISRRLLAPVVRRPAAALVVSLAALVAVAAPSLTMKIHDASLETLPQDIPQVQTFQHVSAAFPSQGTTATVVLHGSPADRGAMVAALHSVAGRARSTHLFAAPGPGAVRTSADGATSVLTLPIPFEFSDHRSAEAVTELRDTLVPQAVSGLPVEHAVGGDPAESLDYANRLQDRLPLVIGFVLLLTLLMMAVTFRSLSVAVVSTLLNLLSVGVAFGVLTLVFQHGWFAVTLDFTTPGFVITWIPLFVMVVLVGLSMDYNVFVLARIREHALHGLPTRLAVQRGISETGGVVASAAAVMVSVFALFATLSMMEMKMMGVALATSILVDATVIRLVVLPAALVLLGDRAWWPGRIRRPRGTVVEASPEQVLASHSG